MEHPTDLHALSLVYLHDPGTIQNLPQGRIFEELADGNYRALVFRPERWRLADHDHLVLARARRDSRHIGLLAASDGHSGREAFLHLETAFLPPDTADLHLLQRMLALMLLRIEGQDAAPAVISACTGDAACLAALRQLAACCPGAVLFPETDKVATLATVALARRIAPHVMPRAQLDVSCGRISDVVDQVLAVLDLRGCSSLDVMDAARDIYRARRARTAQRQTVDETQVVRRAAGS